MNSTQASYFELIFLLGILVSPIVLMAIVIYIRFYIPRYRRIRQLTTAFRAYINMEYGKFSEEVQRSEDELVNNIAAQLNGAHAVNSVSQVLQKSTKAKPLFTPNTLNSIASTSQISRHNLLLPQTDEITADLSVSAEVAHGRKLLEIATQKRRLLEEKTMELGANVPAHVIVQLDQSREQISLLNQQLQQLEQHQSSTPLQTAQQSSGQQSAAPHQTTQQLPQTQQLGARPQDFSPLWSVVRSQVRYVDANLAMRYVEDSQDANIMLGLTTLFLGSTITFGFSIWTSGASLNSTVTATNITATVLTALATIIFFALTWRSMRKVESIRKTLFEDVP